MQPRETGWGYLLPYTHFLPYSALRAANSHVFECAVTKQENILTDKYKEFLAVRLFIWKEGVKELKAYQLLKPSSFTI